MIHTSKSVEHAVIDKDCIKYPEKSLAELKKSMSGLPIPPDHAVM